MDCSERKEKRRIMILGAGPAQLPLLRAAREMGYETVVASIPGPYPCLEKADIVSYTDVTDKEAVAATAAEYGVSGVASCCLEICLPAQAYACEKLGLPGPSRDAAEISVNKLAMHRAFDRGGVRAPRYRVLRSAADLDGAVADLGLPMVVKAPDLWSSRGVYVVRSTEEAAEALAQSLSMTGESYVLAEEYIAGRSFCAEAFVQRGEILFVLPDGNLTVSNPGRPDIPVGHYAPFDCAPDVMERIRSDVASVIRACGLDNCAVNMDLVLRDGETYVIELTARAGATALSELISQYFGVDYYRMILLAALGEDARPYFNARPSRPLPTAAAMLTSDRDGIVRSVRLPAALPESVRELTLFVKAGDRVRRFSNAGDRIGQIIVAGETAEACLRTVDEVLSAVQVELDA